MFLPRIRLDWTLWWFIQGHNGKLKKRHLTCIFTVVAQWLNHRLAVLYKPTWCVFHNTVSLTKKSVPLERSTCQSGWFFFFFLNEPLPTFNIVMWNCKSITNCDTSWLQYVASYKDEEMWKLDRRELILKGFFHVFLIIVNYHK